MQKQAPTPLRILFMAGFALSCFGLLLFLWLSFGGNVPLKPKGYRFQVGFPEATQLGLQADVRVSGVSIGKVVDKTLDPRGNRTLATIQVQRKFAPIRSDARAILRQKTLLGETYVELTPGSPGARPLKEGGRLADGDVRDAVQLDEIFNALDPRTRKAFQTWQQSLATAVRGRGQDLNDVLGNLPGFARDTTDILAVLDDQRADLRRAISNTGVTFEAITQDEAQLHNLVVGSGQVFDATASQNAALAEAFRIFPTFLDESKRTMVRLKSFARDTDPLIRELRQPTRDLGPTLRSVRGLAPDLRFFFRNLSPLITVSRTGLPALTDVLNGARPLLGNLGPFLGQLNPILEWLEQNQHTTADFISQGANALNARAASRTPGGQGHYLRQFGPEGPEALAVYGQRLPTDRGNSYLWGDALASPTAAQTLQSFPSFDCRNTGGDHGPVDSDSPTATPGCGTQPHPTVQGAAQGGVAHLQPEDYRGRR